MNDRSDTFRSSSEGVMIPRIWVMIALSVLVHIAALWELPPLSVRMPEIGEDPDQHPALTARLAPPAPPLPPAGAVPSQSSPKPAVRAQRPKTAPQVIAPIKPVPDAPAPAPRPAPSVMAGDMASYIEARRRARGASEPAPAAEAGNDRTGDIVAGNLQRDLSFGYDPSRSGGVFQIERLNDDYAEFIFHGWNKNVGRNTKQLIEVPRGNNGNIRIAVVRKMVSIIRDHEKEDFVWVSQRLGRKVTLSARARDNAGLEEFMMREFFFETTPAQR